MIDAPAAVEAALRSLFPAGVAVAVEPIVPTGADRLWPEELPAVAGAVPARLAEFVAGRSAARRALAALDQPPQALPMGADRAAIWPVGITGSIAHAAGLAVAVARRGDAPLGVDIEDDTAIAPDLWPVLCGPAELQRLVGDHGKGVKRLFCAKEAVFKAQAPDHRAMFGHEMLTVTLAGDRFDASFLGDAGAFRAGQIVRGRIAVAAGRILAGVAV